jgi:pimeloyl-ACP methyl ester carboxylesterase
VQSGLENYSIDHTLNQKEGMSIFVLVHGSYQGGWIWKPTAECLRDAGHRVYAPTLDGCGEHRHQIRPGITIASQAQEVADLLFYEDLWEVVLVGTSTGGLVVCKVAELARERISRIVFVDALAPQPGERVSDIVIRSPDRPLLTTDLTRGPSRDEVENRMFANLEPESKAWAMARYTMHPIGASDAPGELDGFWAQSWPATVIRCRRSVNPSQAHQRRTAEKLNASWHELDAGHYPMLSHPEELAELLQGNPEI